MHRYRGAVGKDTGKRIYLHRKYVDLVFPDLVEFLENYNHFDYNLLRINKNKTELSLINCKEFDYVDEPIVGEVTRINILENQIISVKNYTILIYHHKWLWVTDDYSGFDIEKAKLRSERQSKLPLDLHRIGFKDHWQKMIAKYNNFS